MTLNIANASFVSRRSLMTLALAGVVFSLAVSPSHARRTYDGFTPHEETICHDAGLTGSLFGLCNAFCEALDCDSREEFTPGCSSVLRQFVQHSGGDMVPPCLFIDSDDDGVDDRDDVCPDVYDPKQADSDADGVGDACDNCPAVVNPDQADSNGNGNGDACDCPCWNETEIAAVFDECAAASGGIDGDMVYAECTDPTVLVIELSDFGPEGTYCAKTTLTEEVVFGPLSALQHEICKIYVEEAEIPVIE